MSYIDTTMWMLFEHESLPFEGVRDLLMYMTVTGFLEQHEEQE